MRAASGWRSSLRADPVEWLLEPDNPSVRYFTLRDLLERSEDDRAMWDTKRAIMETGPVPLILEKEDPGGFWGVPEDLHVRSKYEGTAWTVMLLAELGADGNDKRILRSRKFLVKYSQDREGGGFADTGSDAEGGRPSAVLPCLTANLVWSFLRFGYADRSSVQEGLDYLLKYLGPADGEAEAPGDRPGGAPGDRCDPPDPDVVVVKALRAFAEIPTEKRSPEVRAAIERGADHLVNHCLYRKAGGLKKGQWASWQRFGFPLTWKTDALDILDVLTSLGLRDGRMQDAIELVLSKQDSGGRWRNEGDLAGRLMVTLERKGRPSKWVTLKALRVLKRYLS